MDGVAGSFSDQARHHLNMVVSSGRRLTRLVDDILDFSKMKSGQVVLSRRSVSPREAADTVLALSKPLLEDKSLVLINEIDEKVPAVFVDANRLQQILFNLVGNAIKFTREGRIRVSAAVEGDQLAISVADTGIGIPKDSLESIFGMFEQVGDSGTREQGGAGLGLSITRKLVELQGGQINVNSEVGAGSCFTFTLPLARADQQSEARAPVVVNADIGPSEEATVLIRPAGKPGGKRILVVDDEPINLQVLLNHLTLRGYDVEQAGDGVSALELLEAHDNFELVILDVMMPGMSGYEVCRAIREKYSLHELPVLMLTARNQMADMTQGLESGANDYLTKPFDKRELLARTASLLGLREAWCAAFDKQQRLEQEQSLRRDMEIQRTAMEYQIAATSKAMNEAREVSQQKTDFLALMSHELRTPLNAIIGYSEILHEDLELDGQSGFIPDIKKIQTSAKSLLNLINNLLDLTKIEAGKMDIYTEDFKLATLMDEIRVTLEPLVERNHNVFNVFQAPEIDFIHSDHTKLRIVVMNLLGNACKFTRQGQIDLNITTCPEDQQSMILEVKDTGIGMTPEQQQRIFEPFVQAERDVNRKYGGTGLGLVITRKFCEMLGGEIDVSSQVGKGSNFRIRFPKAKNKDQK